MKKSGASPLREAPDFLSNLIEKCCKWAVKCLRQCNQGPDAGAAVPTGGETAECGEVDAGLAGERGNSQMTKRHLLRQHLC